MLLDIEIPGHLPPWIPLFQPTLDSPGSRFGAVERIDLAGGRVLAARQYFETGVLARALGAPGA